MKSATNLNINNKEIDNLEQYLISFQEKWAQTQAIRSSKWRKSFLYCFIIAIVFSTLIPQVWWLGFIVVTYFASSLFTLLRQNAKTSHQILEHKKQIRLARLLTNLEPEPYLKK